MGGRLGGRLTAKEISIRDPAWPYYTSSTVAIDATTRKNPENQAALADKEWIQRWKSEVSLKRQAGSSQQSAREHKVSRQQSDKLLLFAQHVHSAQQWPTANKLNIPSPCWTVVFVVSSVTSGGRRRLPATIYRTAPSINRSCTQQTAETMFQLQLH